MSLIDFVLDTDPQPAPEWFTELQRRQAANERYHCEDCFAFVSNERGRGSSGYDYTGEPYGPYCEPGKGCNKERT